MPVLHAVRVRVRLNPAALEIFTAHQAGVDVQMRQRHRTQLLKVKIQHRSINCVKVGTVSAPLVHRFPAIIYFGYCSFPRLCSIFSMFSHGTVNWCWTRTDVQLLLVLDTTRCSTSIGAGHVQMFNFYWCWTRPDVQLLLVLDTTRCSTSIGAGHDQMVNC